MMKIFVLALCVALSLLTGCSSQSDSGSAIAEKKEKTEVMGTGKNIALPKQSDYKNEP